MSRWRLTLRSSTWPAGVVEAGESQFVIGSETAPDVLTVAGEGVAARHAWFCFSADGVQVEDLAGSTWVNGHRIRERVQVQCPATVQLGGISVDLEWIGEREPEGGARGRAQPDAPLEGGYTLGREIARGGMGCIFCGEDLQLKREVAVKVSVQAGAGQDPRFIKEAEILARLAHPNIVPIYNRGTDAKGRPFYSMKLIKGRTLQAVLHALGRGDPEAVREYPLGALLTVFRKVCDALAFAHSEGILHRDLKPENVMVGEYGEVLVMDWGLAKALGESGSADSERVRKPDGPGAPDAVDCGMTLEGEVMGTPQYMSPEQARGMVADLDTRSDIYSLGGILYAVLTLRAPVEGKTLHEVLERVKTGSIRAAEAGFSGVDRRVPEALQAVALKALALDREKRYERVEELAADVEAFQNGFATRAEKAGFGRQVWLWVRRNRVLAGSVAVLMVVVGGFSFRVVAEGKKAAAALNRLQKTAPTFIARARDAIEDGQLGEAMEGVDFAVDLEPENPAYHALRGNILQVLERWPEAVDAYRRSLRFGDDEGVKANLALTGELIARAGQGDESAARASLFEALNRQGRRYEAMEFGRRLGDFWNQRNRGAKDPGALPELVRRLEANLVPVPGTGILLGRTEFTVGEWKLYLRAEGMPQWQQPDVKEWEQSDEHPVVNVNWPDAKNFSDWLSAKTGKTWRLPTNAEWDAAVGTTTYPWGEYFPPNWDDGNYPVLSNGREDPQNTGVDGIRGTAPVGSFKPNALGFYDLGGNVWEWTWDQASAGKTTGFRSVRGGAWIFNRENGRSAFRWSCDPVFRGKNVGFRVALVVGAR